MPEFRRCCSISFIPDQPNRNAAALKGLDAAIKQKPGAFFTPDAARLITPGNFEDDLSAVRDCDWIIEAVAENLEIKRGLLDEGGAAPRAGRDRLHQHQRHSAGADLGRISARNSARIFWARTSSIRRAICIWWR